MRSAFVESPDEFHQVTRVLERVARLIVGASARWISPKRENISDARFRVAAQNRIDLRFAVADAGQMRNRIELGGVLDALDQVVRQVAGRSARAVGHANEVRSVRFQFANRLVETLGRLRSF